MSDTQQKSSLDPELLPGGKMHTSFHLAVAWLRLGDAASNVHFEVRSLDDPIIVAINVLREQAWSYLWDLTGGDSLKLDGALDRGKSWIRGNG